LYETLLNKLNEDQLAAAKQVFCSFLKLPTNANFNAIENKAGT